VDQRDGDRALSDRGHEGHGVVADRSPDHHLVRGQHIGRY
jgi:hypothetical protein